MDLKSIVTASVIGALAGAGMSYCYFQTQLDAINDRLSLTPPVAIVDFAKLASQYPEGASPEEIERLMVTTNDSIVKLRDAGYLVLDAGSVLKAPADIYVNLDQLK